MQSGANTIADYNEGADADAAFAVTSGVAHLGFSPEGSDITSFFKDNGSLCGLGGLDTPLTCWAGLSTTGMTISEGAGSNHPDGATTTIHFRVGIGSGANIITGLYTATSTLTALPL
jgi:hypothetical protein